MKTLILIGRSGCGKTALAKRLTGAATDTGKTPVAQRIDWVIDTPGGYAESMMLGGALSLYAYEADIVGLIISAVEPYSLYNPHITAMVNRRVVGIVTKTDKENADTARAERWLRLAGCNDVFPVSAVTGEGIRELLEFLRDCS